HYYVLKSDAESYFASIQHHIVLRQVKQWIHDPIILELLWQFITQRRDHAGVLYPTTQGISKGSRLSVILGAIYLDTLDRVLSSLASKVNGYYCRYVDDWIFMCTQRHQLRKALKLMYQVLNELGLTIAKKKTYVGKIEKGFDWLGYRVNWKRVITDDSREVLGCHSNSTLLKNIYYLTVSQTSLKNHFEKYHRLYEQGASKRALIEYLVRWCQWVNSGLVATPYVQLRV
ncbi:reverse transcriptase domain-containing protein, partial [Vibrio sonorensis]|uniref:reverse transcriptase domain-containing protein n=1 Tax=Vibrio sonorensis TaxID=1004316 RepID=UPI001FE12F9C